VVAASTVTIMDTGPLTRLVRGRCGSFTASFQTIT